MRRRYETKEIKNSRNHVCGLAFLLVLSLTGCRRTPGEAAAATAPNETTPTPFAVVSPQRAAIQREVANPAEIESFEETPLFAKVSGYVKEGWKDIGIKLRKDQILAELWVPEREVELRHKQALLRQAESEIQQARRMVTVAEAAFHSAEAKVTEAEAKLQAVEARHKRMKSQYDRMAQMRQVVNKENIEEAQLGYLTAQANLAEAEAAVKFAQTFQVECKARWNKAEADLKVAEDHRRVAGEERDYAHTMLDYARLPAPYDCVVIKRNVKTGDFVQPPTNGAGRPLYIVHRTDLMRIIVQVPEKEAPWVQEGVTADIRVQALPGRTFTGKVARTSWSHNESTRTLRAEIDLTNKDGSLRPGMYAYATLKAEIPDLLTLPRSAVITEGDVTRGYQTFCYELRDGKPQRLLLEIGVGDRRRIQVLKKQLPPNKTEEPPRWVEVTARESILRDAANSSSFAR
jgi:HlyD family secretion protein